MLRSQLVVNAGEQYGMLTVFEREPGRVGRWFRCLCQCGQFTSARSKDLLRGKKKSCGRYKMLHNRTHGMSRSRSEYCIWQGMIQRCTNPKEKKWMSYGGRGISVCTRWRTSFMDFLADVGERPSMKHTLDRYPNQDGNYEPGNVRWATIKEQNNNYRRNIRLTYQNRTQNLREWSVEFGINEVTLKQRLKRGWDMGKALTTPPMESKRSRKKVERAFAEVGATL
jgi:hypothetical protein